jgi:hypothetical protein
MVASQADAGESCRKGLEAVVRAYVGFCLDNAELAATGMLAPEIAEHGLDDVIAFILRGCAPDGRLTGKTDRKPVRPGGIPLGAGVSGGRSRPWPRCRRRGRSWPR